MSVREDAVVVECRLQERLHFVLARTWDLLPETIYRRLIKEIGGNERRPTWHTVERWLYIAPVDAVERFLSGRLSYPRLK